MGCMHVSGWGEGKREREREKNLKITDTLSGKLEASTTKKMNKNNKKTRLLTTMSVNHGKADKNEVTATSKTQSQLVKNNHTSARKLLSPVTQERTFIIPLQKVKGYMFSKLVGGPFIILLEQKICITKTVGKYQ